MLQTRKVSNDVVAVAWEPTEIYLRPSGKQYFGQEECLAKIVNGRLYIYEDVADKYGITLDYSGSGTPTL